MRFSTFSATAVILGAAMALPSQQPGYGAVAPANDYSATSGSQDAPCPEEEKAKTPAPAPDCNGIECHIVCTGIDCPSEKPEEKCEGYPDCVTQEEECHDEHCPTTPEQPEEPEHPEQPEEPEHPEQPEEPEHPEQPEEPEHPEQPEEPEHPKQPEEPEHPEQPEEPEQPKCEGYPNCVIECKGVDCASSDMGDDDKCVGEHCAEVPEQGNDGDDTDSDDTDNDDTDDEDNSDDTPENSPEEQTPTYGTTDTPQNSPEEQTPTYGTTDTPQNSPEEQTPTYGTTDTPQNSPDTPENSPEEKTPTYGTTGTPENSPEEKTPTYGTTDTPENSPEEQTPTQDTPKEPEYVCTGVECPPEQPTGTTPYPYYPTSTGYPEMPRNQTYNNNPNVTPSEYHGAASTYGYSFVAIFAAAGALFLV